MSHFCLLVAEREFVSCWSVISEGTQSEDASWPENVENAQIVSFPGLVRMFYQYIYATFFLLPNLTLGRSHIGSLFTTEEQKMVGA